MRSGLGQRFVAGALIACGWVWITAETASAQLLYSFENSFDGFTAQNVTLANSSTLGVTDGMQSLVMDNLVSGFQNDTGVATHGAGSGNAYTVWAGAGSAIAAGKENVKLEFDYTWDHAAVTGNAAFAQLGIFVNSNGPGYKQYGTGALINGNIGAGGSGFPTLADAAIADGVTMTELSPTSVHFAIPMGPTRHLHVGAPNGNFYQMGFKTNGGWGSTVDWAIDNVRITGAVNPTTSQTLFSWETPDNPATPAVNEQFEGWTTGFQPGHVHSISTTGATHGTSALQIDRTVSPNNFSWGSQFVLNSDINPDPTVEQIDPDIQARITDLITKVEAADRLAFDVTFQYQDRFPLPDPTFTQFFAYILDETSKFYQAQAPQNLNVVGATSPQTVTIDIPLASFVDAGDTMNTLKTTGLLNDSNVFRLGIGTNTDGGQVYQIDNLRLITEITEGVTGDYNDDGTVDAADYVVWRDNLGTNNALPNNPLSGPIGPTHYDQWKANFGRTAAGAATSEQLGALVPEPAAVWLALGLLACGAATRTRQHNRPRA